MIRYREGYKYVLAETYSIQTDTRPATDIITEYITLTTAGLLTIMKGYAWDGASGPAIDTKDFIRPSLIHDAFYNLFRLRLLDLGWREAVDDLLQKMFLEDAKKVKRPWYSGWLKHLAPIRAWWIHRGVRLGGEASAKWQDEVILEAP